MPFVRRHRDYYKYEDWTQPILAANGTVGGDSFACFAGSAYSTTPAYYAFNDTISNGWASNSVGGQDYIGFYNPEPLMVTNINYTNYEWVIGGWEVYGSNDNTSYELLAEGTNTTTDNGLSWDMDLSSNKKAFKYYKIVCLTTIKGQRVGAGEIKITAKLLGVETTAKDADYYIDSNKMYTPVKRHRSYYKYGTEPNATVAGSFAKIDKGVASGFTTANYLSMDKVLPFSSQDNIDIVIKARSNSATASQALIGNTNDAASGGGIAVRTNGGSRLYLWGTNNNSSWGLQQFDTGIDLSTDFKYIKFTYTYTLLSCWWSSNGIDWNEGNSIVINKVTDTTLRLGIIGARYPLDGSIDLSQSYININGERWWSGDSYTKVGSWIDEDVVSGFTTANYLSLPKLFRPSNSPWERVMCFTTGSNVTTAQMIDYINHNGSNIAGAFIQVYNSKTNMALSSNGSSFNIANDVGGTTVLQPNTTYYVKLKYTGAEYQMYLSTTGEFAGEETLEASVTSSTSIYQNNTVLDRLGARNSSQPFLGSIDLSKCYVNINEQRWWHGTKAVESTEAGFDYYKDSNKLYTPVRTKRIYYKYGDTPAFINLANSDNTAWITTDGKFSFYYYNGTADDTRNLIRPVKATKLFIKATIGYQANAHGDFVVFAITESGTYEVVRRSCGYGESAEVEFTYEFDKIETITGIRIVNSSYAGTNQYCYGGVTASVYRNSPVETTVEDADYYEQETKLY